MRLAKMPETANFLAFGDQCADTSPGEESRNACAAGADAFGQYTKITQLSDT